jgi:Ca2+-transporting ATPase
MKRPPRDPRESVFSWDVRMFILLALVIEIPVFYYLFYHKLDDITDARTKTFFLFIVIELMIALNFRSMRYSIFKARPHKWLVLALIWEVVLIAVLIQLPSVRDAFGINKPSTSDLGIIVVFGIVVFISVEVIKAVIRSRMTVRRSVSL